MVTPVVMMPRDGIAIGVGLSRSDPVSRGPLVNVVPTPWRGA